jgi:cytochrome c5
MHLRRSVVIPVMLIAGTALAVSYVAMPVEARTTSVSSSLVKQVFSASSLPMDRETFFAGSATGRNIGDQAAPPLPDGKGKDVAQQKCSTCHATNIWSTQHHTREQWGSIIDNMISKGLEASDEELDTITDYLAQNFGPVAKAPSPTAPTDPPAPPPSDPATTKPPVP